MGLEKANVIDAIGTERTSGEIVLTIFDALDWSDPTLHLQALTDKLDTYFAFVEGGQVFEDYPAAVGGRIRIDIVMRHPPAPVGLEFIDKANDLASELNVVVSHQVFRGSSATALQRALPGGSNARPYTTLRVVPPPRRRRRGGIR